MFAPHELGAALDAPVSGSGIAVQLLGTVYIAFAVTNWIGKDKPIGGIYSRPLSVGNFAHFAIGALVLLNRAMEGDVSTVLIATGAIYAALAAAFARLAFAGSAILGARVDR
nr:hypothetical protein [Gammaproteobacteria bacterium]